MPSQTGFIGPSYTLKSINVDAQRCVNMYPEMNELGTGKNREIASLVSTPGLKLIRGALDTTTNPPVLSGTFLPDVANRGLYLTSTGKLFGVTGDMLWELTSDSVFGVDYFQIRGFLGTTIGPVAISDNGVQVIIVDGQKGYIYTPATFTITEITDEDFPRAAGNNLTGGPPVVEFMDGYFIINTPNSRQFQISALYDGLSWDGLDFGLKEGQPDNLVTLINNHRELWLFGDQTTEVWWNNGDADFPFSRIQGAFIEHGIAAKDSLQKLDQSLFWVGKDKNGDAIIWRASQYQPERISTYAIEEKIKSYGDISKTTSYSYQDRGHSFYCLNFPGADSTLCFDTTINLWHDRQSSKSSGFYGRHRAESHVFFNGRHIVGDYQNRNIYELTDDSLTDNGAPIVRLRRAPHITNEGEWVFFQKFQLDMETGVGLSSGQGDDPKAMLRFSDDGGHTWSNEQQASVGKMGSYKTRAIWRRLGRSRDRVWEVKITDPVRVTMISALIEAE